MRQTDEANTRLINWLVISARSLAARACLLPRAFMFLSVWMTRQLDATPSSFRRASTKKCRASDMRRRYDSIVVVASRRLSATESFALPCLCECASRIPSRVTQSVIDPRRWSFAGRRGAARVPIPGRRAARPDEIASVTQGSGNMVALMPRIFFAVASVGIAVLITALILTALRL